MTRGSEWAEHVRQKYALNESEDVLVSICADVIDTLDGPLDTVERRQQQLALMRALSQLNLPEEGGDRKAATTRKASRAARVRWDREAI